YKPTITKVTGDVYAGGFFFLAGSNIVIAQKDLKFGLPEVKRGLFPFQVMECLTHVMPTRKVLDWCMRGYNLPVEEAMQLGLVTQIVEASAIDQVVNEIVKAIKENSPTAIRHGLIAFDHIKDRTAQHQYLMEMFMKTLGSRDGQEGIKAFKEKRKPVWTGE
ncbi:MAG: enoyl-CoA hydratase-related protein, partial [Bacteroidota bacterium]